MQCYKLVLDAYLHTMKNDWKGATCARVYRVYTCNLCIIPPHESNSMMLIFMKNDKALQHLVRTLNINLIKICPVVLDLKTYRKMNGWTDRLTNLPSIHSVSAYNLKNEQATGLKMKFKGWHVMHISHCLKIWSGKLLIVKIPECSLSSIRHGRSRGGR
jgi:hypothetical protein